MFRPPIRQVFTGNKMPFMVLLQQGVLQITQQRRSIADSNQEVRPSLCRLFTILVLFVIVFLSVRVIVCIEVCICLQFCQFACNMCHEGNIYQDIIRKSIVVGHSRFMFDAK